MLVHHQESDTTEWIDHHHRWKYEFSSPQKHTKVSLYPLFYQKYTEKNLAYRIYFTFFTQKLHFINSCKETINTLN